MRKYENVAEICRITGVRECELERLTPECFRLGEDGKVFVHLDGKLQNTKGGKTRDVVIIDSNQQRIRDILAILVPNELICPKSPSHLDVHGIRALYAADYYSAIARPIDSICKEERVKLKHPRKEPKVSGRVYSSAPAIYRRKSDGKKYDRCALLVVSESLGHHRVDVVVLNYLR